MTLELTKESIREKWIRRFNTPRTKTQARAALSAYDVFLKNRMGATEIKPIQEYEATVFKGLLESDEEERYLFLDEMVQFWKEQAKSPATIHNYFTFIRSYLRHNRVKTEQEDIKEYVSFPRQVKEIRQPITIPQIKQLLEFCNPQIKALVLVLISSGMRIGETLQLRVSDIDVTAKPKRINIRAETTKTKQGREAYISTEAWTYLQPFMRGRSPDELVFEISQPNALAYMHRLRKKTRMTEKYSNGWTHLVTYHTFRAFFHTKATLLHGVEYAHAVLGHGSYLQQYFRLTAEERAKKYIELEPYLTVYTDTRAVVENKKLHMQQDVMNQKLDVIERFLARNPEFRKEFAALCK